MAKCLYCDAPIKAPPRSGSLKVREILSRCRKCDEVILDYLAVQTFISRGVDVSGWTRA